MQHDFILLDRSGSMQSQWGEALNSVNGYVEKLASDQIDTGVTLATFDENLGAFTFDVVRDRIVPRTWRNVSSADALPRGRTPLNDAVGRLVQLANKGAPGGQQYEKVAIIIMTDGLENASKEFTHEAARKALDECRAKGWQVLMLGANFDNRQQAADYGVAAAATADCIAPENLVHATKAVAAARANYSITGAAMEISEEEKAKLRAP